MITAMLARLSFGSASTITPAIMQRSPRIVNAQRIQRAALSPSAVMSGPAISHLARIGSREVGSVQRKSLGPVRLDTGADIPNAPGGNTQAGAPHGSSA